MHNQGVSTVSGKIEPLHGSGNNMHVRPISAGDFDWTQAFVWWRNLDKIIHHTNKVRMFVSMLALHLECNM